MLSEYAKDGKVTLEGLLSMFESIGEPNSSGNGYACFGWEWTIYDMNDSVGSSTVYDYTITVDGEVIEKIYTGKCVKENTYYGLTADEILHLAEKCDCDGWYRKHLGKLYYVQYDTNERQHIEYIEVDGEKIILNVFSK